MVVKYGWSQNMGGRKIWVVAKYGWSQNMGGRKIWVVASYGFDNKYMLT